MSAFSKIRLRITDFPIEIIQEIALHMDDRTLGYFASTCRGVHTALFAEPYGIWRQKFKGRFDELPGMTSKECQEIYIFRASLLRWKYPPGLDLYDVRKIHLFLVHDMLIQAYGGKNVELDHNGKRISNNIRIIDAMARNTRLLCEHFYDEEAAHNFRHTICVCLAHDVLHPATDIGINHVAFVQRIVYEARFTSPLFREDFTKLEMEYFLHVLRFFRLHLLFADGDLLYEFFNRLASYSRPRVWEEQLRPGLQAMEPHWLGTRAMMQEPEKLLYLRTQYRTHIHLEDYFPCNHHGGFDRLLVTGQTSYPRNTPGYVPDDDITYIPLDSFSVHVRNLLQVPFYIRGLIRRRVKKPQHESTRRSRARNPLGFDIDLTNPQLLFSFMSTVHPSMYPSVSPDYIHTDPLRLEEGPNGNVDIVRDVLTEIQTPFIRFTATGYDGRIFGVHGIIHEMPDQEGIPGFHRLTMFKYYPSDDGEVDEDDLVCYEGCIIPGGQMMLGRWFIPEWEVNSVTGSVRMVDDVTIESGPFIWWTLDIETMQRVQQAQNQAQAQAEAQAEAGNQTASE